MENVDLESQKTQKSKEEAKTAKQILCNPLKNHNASFRHTWCDFVFVK